VIKKNNRDILLKLCDELSKKEVDTRKVNKLLKQTDILPTNNPFELANQLLKRLHNVDPD